MKKNYFLFLCSFLLLGFTALAQSGNGHDPDLVLSYTPTSVITYTAATTMRQDNGFTSFSKNTVNNNGGGTQLWFNFTFDTTNKNAWVVYTTDGSEPSQSNGTQVAATFSNFSLPNRTWTATIPSSANSTSGTTVKYLFYISDGAIGASWGIISNSSGYSTSWSEGSETGYSYVVLDSNVSAGGNWSSTSTWNSGSVPNSSSTSIEIIGTNPVTVDQNTELLNLTVFSGASLSINSGNGLNVTGNLTNSGTITAINGASLGVDGTASGDITYKRSVSTTNWYLMASPVVGETAVDFLNNSGNIENNGSEFAIGTYGYDDGWTYNYSNTFESGKGYAVKKSIAGDLVFTGTYQNADVAVAVIDTNVGGLLDYNVYGNPYLSFVAVNSSADATNNILTVNTNAGQDELATAQIWLWDGVNDDYDVINHASPAFFLAPGQGFIVQGKGGFGDSFFNFTEGMTSHVNSDSFQKSSVKKTSRPEIKLFINDGTASKHTDIYYINGTTTGFDNGYDGTIFGGASVSFKVFTGLVSDSQGEKLGIQSLPDSGYENMTIPVGVIAEANTEITFTANTTNIPSGLKVFLEDRETNTFTRLDEANGEYKVTLSQDVNDVGRFYLHTTAAALSVPEVHLENVSVYTTHATNIRIEGIALGKTQMKLVNMLGKEVLQQNFSSNGVSDIAIPKLARGIYIVQLNTEKGKLNKKIIID